MSKRNRRRTRGGGGGAGGRRHASLSLLQTDNFEISGLYGGEPPDHHHGFTGLSKTPTTIAGSTVVVRRSDHLSATHWRNRFLAWQAREREQWEEQEKLRQEQRRIFGGDSQDRGEDADRLCASMLDYFDRLDYLKEDYSTG